MCRRPQVIVHDLEQAQAALAAGAELGIAIELRSAPGAAAYAGVGYLEALGDQAGQALLIDCGDDGGLVMAALRAGCRKLAFSGAAALAERLADMAAQVGLRLVVRARAAAGARSGGGRRPRPNQSRLAAGPAGATASGRRSPLIRRRRASGAASATVRIIDALDSGRHLRRNAASDASSRDGSGRG